MNLRSWAKIGMDHRTAVVLVALVTTFAGVALVIDRPKGTILEWLALPLLVAGGAVFAWAVWPRGKVATSIRDSLASRLLVRVTFGGRLVPFFPAFGAGIILGDFGYNWLISTTPAIRTEDIIVLLAAVTLLFYRLVPRDFARERDFVLAFFLCLNLILVAPLLIARAYYADFDRSVDLYSWVALAPETSGVLQLVGVANTVHGVTGTTAPGLTFTPQHIPVQVTVVITTACSGIYSFGIFASAFVAFVLTEYQSVSRQVWILLGLGLATAYLANVLRMVVIILVGFYTDTTESDLQNMLIAHSYAGWLIFLGWIALFWWGVFKVTPHTTLEVPSKNPEGATAFRSLCGICANPLTPLIPATKCTCGLYHHKSCILESGLCPSCGQQLSPEGIVLPQGP